MKKKCEQCGTEFDAVRDNQRFCSQKCKDTYHNSQKTAHAIEKAGLENQQPTKVYVSAEWVKTLQNQLTAANDRNTELLAMFQDYMGTSIVAVDKLTNSVAKLVGEFQKKRYNTSYTTTIAVSELFDLDNQIRSVSNAIQMYRNNIQETELYQKYYDTNYDDDEDEEYEDEDEDDEYEDSEEYDDTEDSGANW